MAEAFRFIAMVNDRGNKEKETGTISHLSTAELLTGLDGRPFHHHHCRRPCVP